MEDQLDAAIASKQQTEEELITRREQVIQAGQIITRLEAEKKDLQKQIEQLNEDLIHAERDTSKVDGLDQEVRSLRSQIGVKDRKLHELESNHSQADREKDTKISSLEQELRALKSQISQKDRRADEAERKLDALQKTAKEEKERHSNSYESQIRSLNSQLGTKDRKMGDLESQISRNASALDVSA